jgi:hypothetical protein
MKLSLRGSLKTRPILLTIAFLIAINIGVHTMVNTYQMEVTGLISLYGGQEYLAVSQKPGPESVKVAASFLNIHERGVLLISCDSIEKLLRLSRATISGSLPVEADEAAVGEGIRDLVSDGILVVEGRSLRVRGYVRSNDHLRYSVLTVARIRQDAKTFYFSPQSGEDAVPAPAAQRISASVFSEVLTIMSLVSYLLFVGLALSCLFQGYNSATEAESTLKVFSSMNAPRRMVSAAMLLYASMVAVAGAILGFAFGIFIPGLVSSVISIALKMPHLKPMTGWNVAVDLIVGISSSFPALSIGLLRGFSREIASS